VNFGKKKIGFYDQWGKMEKSRNGGDGDSDGGAAAAWR
jgi:hypothetical protein